MIAFKLHTFICFYLSPGSSESRSVTA